MDQDRLSSGRHSARDVAEEQFRGAVALGRSDRTDLGLRDGLAVGALETRVQGGVVTLVAETAEPPGQDVNELAGRCRSRGEGDELRPGGGGGGGTSIEVVLAPALGPGDVAEISPPDQEYWAAVNPPVCFQSGTFTTESLLVPGPASAPGFKIRFCPQAEQLAAAARWTTGTVIPVETVASAATTTTQAHRARRVPDEGLPLSRLAIDLRCASGHRASSSKFRVVHGDLVGDG